MPWYFQRGEDEIVGPIDLETLHNLAEGGEIDGNTQVAYAESGQQPDAWQLAHSIKSLNLGSGLPRTPRPPQPAAQRIPANHPLQNRQRRIKAPLVGATTIILLVIGVVVGFVGFAALGLHTAETFQSGSISVWMRTVGSSLASLGVQLVMAALLVELVRINQTTMRLAIQLQDRVIEVTEREVPRDRHPLD